MALQRHQQNLHFRYLILTARNVIFYAGSMACLVRSIVAEVQRTLFGPASDRVECKTALTLPVPAASPGCAHGCTHSTVVQCRSSSPSARQKHSDSKQAGKCPSEYGKHQSYQSCHWGTAPPPGIDRACSMDPACALPRMSTTRDSIGVAADAQALAMHGHTVGQSLFSDDVDIADIEFFC